MHAVIPRCPRAQVSTPGSEAGQEALIAELAELMRLQHALMPRTATSADGEDSGAADASVDTVHECLSWLRVALASLGGAANLGSEMRLSATFYATELVCCHHASAPRPVLASRSRTGRRLLYPFPSLPIPAIAGTLAAQRSAAALPPVG